MLDPKTPPLAKPARHFCVQYLRSGSQLRRRSCNCSHFAGAKDDTIQSAILRFRRKIRSLGVEHGDLRLSNILWNEELKKALIIDFHRSSFNNRPKILISRERRHNVEDQPLKRVRLPGNANLRGPFITNHGDIRPANVTWNSELCGPMLIDFAQARLVRKRPLTNTRSDGTHSPYRRAEAAKRFRSCLILLDYGNEVLQLVSVILCATAVHSWGTYEQGQQFNL
ncbi:hypothetical protein CPSG_03888 [Coccidioides posadasii str. Silveira]|uniref:Protein kinase domain-containing protein n=1 Tax=Coccidioides posadasii (strain RMSCC 757 / Silveira) TaxID=443226 RepID=E9D2U0_COCPS|nr:hypothetical protein CPSG_03888 [Coccidioides posadasii str. Silveira]